MKILMNHKNLQYFMIMKQLTHCQIWWIEYLLWFNFKICYQSDKQNQKSDVLTQQSQDLSVNADDEWIVNQFQILLFSEQFEKIWLIFMNHELNEEKTEINKWNMNLDNLMNYKYTHDSWIQLILIMIKISQQQHKEIMLAEYEIL